MEETFLPGLSQVHRCLHCFCGLELRHGHQPHVTPAGCFRYAGPNLISRSAGICARRALRAASHLVQALGHGLIASWHASLKCSWGGTRFHAVALAFT